MYKAATDNLLPTQKDMSPTPRGKVKTLTKRAKSVILGPKKSERLKNEKYSFQNFPSLQATVLGWKIIEIIIQVL